MNFQEILIKGGHADKIGTIGYSHQIAKLKQRIDKQNDELEASKVLYNQLRKVRIQMSLKFNLCGQIDQFFHYLIKRVEVFVY